MVFHTIRLHDTSIVSLNLRSNHLLATTVEEKGEKDEVGRPVNAACEDQDVGFLLLEVSFVRSSIRPTYSEDYMLSPGSQQLQV
jgi:hypothetical protein